MKTALRLLLAGLIALAGFSYAIPELTNTEATNVDTAAERLAWQQAIGTDFEGKSGNFTAEVNGRYVVTATLTVTDPSTPAAGDSFVTYVRSGTATVGGTAYATAGTMIVRSYAGGAWASKVFTPDDAVAITGGTITGITDLAVADGGTGASDAATARTNLGAVGLTGNETIAGDKTMSGNLSVSQDISIRGGEVGSSALTVNTQGAAFPGIAIKTAASQTSSALYIEDSGGNPRAGFDNFGNYFVYAANNVQGLYMADQSAPGGTEKRASFTLRGGSSQYLAINPGRDGSNNAGDLLLAYDFGNVAVGNAIPATKFHVEGSTKLNGDIQTEKTITAAATTGAQTINKNAGSVNFAAAATSLVVTNSRVTTSSVIICTIGTNDATMTSVQAVAGSGSFTIYANAAPTAETRVNFLIIN